MLKVLESFEFKDIEVKSLIKDKFASVREDLIFNTSYSENNSDLACKYKFSFDDAFLHQFGEERLNTIVNSHIDDVLQNEELKPYHTNVDAQKLKQCKFQFLHQLICNETPDFQALKKTHQHLKISEDHFDIYYKSFIQQLRLNKI